MCHHRRRHRHRQVVVASKFILNSCANLHYILISISKACTERVSLSLCNYLSPNVVFRRYIRSCVLVRFGNRVLFVNTQKQNNNKKWMNTSTPSSGTLRFNWDSISLDDDDGELKEEKMKQRGCVLLPNIISLQHISLVYICLFVLITTFVPTRNRRTPHQANTLMISAFKTPKWKY